MPPCTFKVYPVQMGYFVERKLFVISGRHLYLLHVLIWHGL